MDKSLLAGSTALLVLKLLEQEDMYGYQMIEELRRRSDHTFDLKAGTLYPLLHTLEQKGFVASREEVMDTTRPRRYYSLTEGGRRQLSAKEAEWRAYAGAVAKVLDGGVCFG
ncbi:PadR family transcriptional regulator [Anaerolentibacter hominis]|uniref:PadR family transcriptional regulator n=1 Tax=Anaerolentibacter hominis TaxID=3079009 RepID=UPI0031B84FFA